MKTMALFYIGLSLLSNDRMPSPSDRRSSDTAVFRGKAGQPQGSAVKLLHDEGRRVLGELAGRPGGAGRGDAGGGAIVLGKNGRPYFADGRGDFSISHSGAAVAVAWAAGPSCRAGCDIQRVKTGGIFGNIAKTYFSTAESAYVFAGEDPASRFCKIWVLKECYIKLRGLTVFDMAGLPSFITDGNFSFAETPASSPRTPLNFYLYTLGDITGESYMLAAALEGEGVPAIRWFSQDSLPLRSIAAIKAALNPAKTVRPNI
jgi:hypothetical protein